MPFWKSHVDLTHMLKEFTALFQSTNQMKFKGEKQGNIFQAAIGGNFFKYIY